MCKLYYSDRVSPHPVSIDTDTWIITPIKKKDTDILLYDKVRWEHDRYEQDIINPIKLYLNQRALKVKTIRYRFYREEEFKEPIIPTKFNILQLPQCPVGMIAAELNLLE